MQGSTVRTGPAGVCWRTQAPAGEGGLAGRGRHGLRRAGLGAQDEIDRLPAVDRLPVGRAWRRGDACMGGAQGQTGYQGAQKSGRLAFSCARVTALSRPHVFVVQGALDAA